MPRATCRCLPFSPGPQVLERHYAHLSGLGHPGGVLLQIVTGVGKHSPAGRPVLLPAVVAWLSERRLLFDTEEHNTGVVRVLLQDYGF